MGKIYGSPAGTAIEFQKLYYGDTTGKAKHFDKGFIGDENGIARQIFPSMPPGPVPILPPEYQQVEYIYTSAKGAYIDTGLKFGTTNKMTAKLLFPTFTTGGGNVKSYNGISTSSQSASHCFGYSHEGSGKDYLRIELNYKKIINSTTTYSTAYVRVNADHNAHVFTADAKNRLVSIDNTSDSPISGSSLLINSNLSILLFAVQQSSSVGLKSIQWLYYFKWYTNNTLTRSFYPCYRKADNVIGLYEILTGTFFTNQGTGSFLKGPDYIGEL